MAKLIALNPSSDGILRGEFPYELSTLKQQALLFDQIGMFSLPVIWKFFSIAKEVNPNMAREMEAMVADLEWLQQMHIIFEPSVKEEFQNLKLEQFIKTSSDLQRNYFKKTLDEFRAIQIQIEKFQVKEIQDVYRQFALSDESNLAIVRLMSVIMDVTKGVTTVTTLPYTEYARDLPNSKKENVAQVVISKLPLPNNETPWEQIIDYRNDPENQKNLLALRRWIRKTSTEETSRAEIEEEIEWLVNEFHEHMKLHKIKTNTATLEVLVKAPLEIIEDLVKLKFSKIPEPFFALKKRQINLMEAELNAPGKEISYIIKAQEAFQSNE